MSGIKDGCGALPTTYIRLISPTIYTIWVRV